MFLGLKDLPEGPDIRNKEGIVSSCIHLFIFIINTWINEEILSLLEKKSRRFLYFSFFEYFCLAFCSYCAFCHKNVLIFRRLHTSGFV